jgi:hypothetical protein
MLFSSMFGPQLIQGWTGMIFLSCSKDLPIWNTQFGGQEGFSWHVQKHLKPFAVKSARKTPLTWMRPLPSQYYISHHVWGYSLVWTQNVTQWEPGLLFHASEFLTSTKHTNAHTGRQKPQGDHMNSLPVDKEITSLWSEKHTGTNTCYSQGMLRIPYQWNCYHRSIEQYISGTPETKE